MSLRVQGTACSPIAVQNNINEPTKELEGHPAYYSTLTTNDAEAILQGTSPMTYILWMEASNAKGKTPPQYFLSYMDTSLSVIHRPFSHCGTWKNCDPQGRELLADLIPQMMRCKPLECKILINPNHFQKEC